MERVDLPPNSHSPYTMGTKIPSRSWNFSGCLTRHNLGPVPLLIPRDYRDPMVYEVITGPMRIPGSMGIQNSKGRIPKSKVVLSSMRNPGTYGVSGSMGLLGSMGILRSMGSWGSRA